MGDEKAYSSLNTQKTKMRNASRPIGRGVTPRQQNNVDADQGEVAGRLEGQGSHQNLRQSHAGTAALLLHADTTPPGNTLHLSHHEWECDPCRANWSLQSSHRIPTSVLTDPGPAIKTQESILNEDLRSGDRGDVEGALKSNSTNFIVKLRKATWNGSNGRPISQE